MWPEDPWGSDLAAPGPHHRLLVTEARPAAVDAVQDLIVDLVDAEGGRPTSIELIRFETAVVEIVGNIVRHAAAIDPPEHEVRRLRVEVIVEPASLEARFCDDGRPAEIDLGAVTMPDPEAGLESGRGLAMALAAADELAYERIGSINTWRLVCRRS